MNTQAVLKGVIMVVDDNPGNLELIFEHLDRAGFQVILEQRSVQALQQVEIHKPDLILLDVVMPKLNGFDLCQPSCYRVLRAHQQAGCQSNERFPQG